MTVQDQERENLKWIRKIQDAVARESGRLWRLRDRSMKEIRDHSADENCLHRTTQEDKWRT